MWVRKDFLCVGPALPCCCHARGNCRVRSGERRDLTWRNQCKAPSLLGVFEGIDPCSSSRWFPGWAEPAEPTALAPPVVAPHTWLLRVGWKRNGLVERHERPSGTFAHD